MTDDVGAGQPRDLLGYDELVEKALLSVVKSCLARFVNEGPIGDHHFYITFNTEHPDVSMGTDLREKYKPEMTIVLQHQFEQLSVDDQGFAVTLSFGGSDHSLVIPWTAITAFLDPSVNFGLQFRQDSESDASEPLADVESAVSFDALIEQAEESKETSSKAEPVEAVEKETKDGESNIIALDHFRKKDGRSPG
jgi:hypothetical protein